MALGDLLEADQERSGERDLLPQRPSLDGLSKKERVSLVLSATSLSELLTSRGALSTLWGPPPSEERDAPKREPIGLYEVLNELA